MKMHKVKASPRDYQKSESWNTWKKEVSEFPWKYPANERCLILKGYARVTDIDGNTLDFGEGDLVTFPKGLECKWKIIRDVEKKYMLF